MLEGALLLLVNFACLAPTQYSAEAVGIASGPRAPELVKEQLALAGHAASLAVLPSYALVDSRASMHQRSLRLHILPQSHPELVQPLGSQGVEVSLEQLLLSRRKTWMPDD